MTDTTNNPTIPTTPELPMTSSTMPYFWRMYMLERHNKNTGHHFFDAATMRCFYSRAQTIPPYRGRVFVTSEKFSWNSARKYSVREVKPDGGIETIGGFGAFTSRQSAHHFAEAYAAENFVRVGNESVQLPPETKMV